MFARLLAPFVDLLAPSRCPACDTQGLTLPGLCPACAEGLVPLGPSCPTCARPVEGPRSLTCRACRHAAPRFDRLVAPWRYGGPVAEAMCRFKYGGPDGRGRPELATALAALLVPALPALTADLCVPVPADPVRLLRRGFSPPLELARALGVARPGRLVPRLLARRPRPEQASLDAEARRRNVWGMFRVPRPADVDGRHILVLDDVATTGATAREAAATLMNAGAARVTVLVLARAEA